MFCKLAVTVANDLIFVELGSRQQSFFLSFCCAGFSLAVGSGAYSLAVVHGLLTVVVPLVAESASRHVGSVAVAPGLWSSGSVLVASGLSCPAARGIFPDEGLNLRILHWQVDSLPLRYFTKIL